MRTAWTNEVLSAFATRHDGLAVAGEAGEWATPTPAQAGAAFVNEVSDGL